MSTRLRFCLTAVTSMLLLLAGTPAATARPDPGQAAGPVHRELGLLDCALERIDTQFVRCDYLTGAGVPAPFWIPEQR